MTRFEPRPGLDEAVAMRIALPAVRRVAADVRDRAQRHAPDGKVWVTAHDERVRRSHVHADGQVVPDNLRYLVPKVNTGNDLNDIRAGYDQAREPRDPDLPIGNRINCFPADVEVIAEGIVGGYRRWYEGPMVTVRTASGRVLTGTPNHPVLTHRGWVGLGSLDVGSDHVYALVGDDHAGSVHATEPDVERQPAPIGEVVGALAKTGLTHRVRGGLVDFHGDGCDSDVDVVRADGLLLDDLEAARAQGVSDPLFTIADARAGLLPRKGLACLFGVARAALRAARLVRRQGESRSLFGGSLCHAREHGGAAPSPLDARLAEPAIDDQTVDSVVTGQRLNRTPGAVVLDQSFGGRARGEGRYAASTQVAVQSRLRDAELAGQDARRDAFAVALDEIVDLTVAEGWSGHVYNLETRDGTYIGNGIVTHNCRCVSVPLRGAIARMIHVADVSAYGTRVSARVSVSFPRVVESEHPSDPDRGGGWFRQAVAEAVASMRR